MLYMVLYVMLSLILSLIIFGPGMPGICHGQSLFDSDDIPMDMPVKTEKPVKPEGPGRNLFFTIFLDQSIWTLGYRASYRTGPDPRLINNHLFLRQEMETLVAEAYFFKLDWKARAYPKTDHRAHAKDRDLYLEADLREAYLQAGGDNFSIKLGDQINVWGKADTMAVTDVVSPRDASEFIFFKIEDARFGQWNVSSTLYRDNSSLFVFLSPLPATDKTPETGTHYFRSLPATENLYLVDDSPEFGDMEAGMKMDHLFSKTEVSVMGGRFYANSPVYETRNLAVHKTYPAYTMSGVAVGHALEAFLIKFELAFKKGFPLQGMDAKGSFLPVESDIIEGAAGIEYNANDVYFMSLELSNRHIFSDRSSLVHGRQDTAALYYTLTKNFWHDTLALEYNFYYHLQEQNHFHNFQATFDLTDAIEIQARYTLLNITDTQSLMWAYKDEDRMAMEIRYAF